MFIAVFATLIASRLLLSIVTTLACNRRQSVYDNRGPVKIKLLGRTDKQGREIVFFDTTALFSDIPQFCFTDISWPAGRDCFFIITVR